MNIVSLTGAKGRDDAIERLRAFIDEGGYGPGDRLPPERELIGSLDMTRATLRKALDALEREGAIWRHVGKGTFISRGAAAGEPGVLAELSQQITPFRMMRARIAMEPAIAREAAINASAGALALLARIADDAENAASWDDYEALDDRFHRAIAEATDNPLLVLLFDQLNQVRRSVAWSTVVRDTKRPPETHTSFAEHRDILAAILERDGAGAQDAMRRHLGSVSSRLFGEPL